MADCRVCCGEAEAEEQENWQCKALNEAPPLKNEARLWPMKRRKAA